jgi:hypothetical protein
MRDIFDNPGRASPCRLLIVLVLALPACGPAPTAGGTTGTLTTDGHPVLDVQVTVFEADSGLKLGFAVTRGDGTFELVTPDAGAPLRLKPGSYRVTLESVGAAIELPQDYLDAETTPLAFDWSEGEPLNLNATGLKLK